MNESEPQDTSYKDQNRSRVRASDAERERVADRLRSAAADGRLSLEEGDERLAALYAMKFRDELPSLTRDLPGDAGDEPQDGFWGRAGGWGPGWGPGGARQTPSEGAASGEAGGPGWSRPAGFGGPGFGGPGWGGPGRGPGWGGPGWGMRRAPWPFRVFPVVVLLIIVGAIVSAVGGHFFWPIIPLFFLTMAFTRFAFFRACRRGWTR